ELMKERYEGFMRDVPCPVCLGTRLKPEILAVTLTAGERGAKSIAEVCELFVVDEPSIGLHQRDNRRLIETLTRLRNLGNTLIVVEHDEDTIEHADWVVDIGPGAGEHGGHIVHSGTYADLLTNKESITGAYL